MQIILKPQVIEIVAQQTQIKIQRVKSVSDRPNPTISKC